MKKSLNRRVKEFFLASSVISMLSFSGAEIYGRSLMKKHEEEILDKTEKVMKIQKEVLDIYDFGKPTISLNPLFSLMGKSSNLRGAYSYFFDITWINVEDEKMENVIAHEEGHRYDNNLRQKLGLRKNIFRNIGLKLSDRGRLVDEGIADYFETMFRVKYDSSVITSDSLQKSFRDYKDKIGCPTCYYSAGFPLVKPILDIDLNKGIEALARNLPTEEDMNDLRGYQKRILDIVKKNAP